MIEKAFDDCESLRFQTLVAHVEAKIRNHDTASVCASPASVAIAPATSSEVAPEFQNHIQITATQTTICTDLFRTSAGDTPREKAQRLKI